MSDSLFILSHPFLVHTLPSWTKLTDISVVHAKRKQHLLSQYYGTALQEPSNSCITTMQRNLSRSSAMRSLTPLAGARTNTRNKVSLTAVMLLVSLIITLSCLSKKCSGSFVPTILSPSLQSKRNYHRLAVASTNGFGVDFARHVAQTVHPSVALVTPMGVRKQHNVSGIRIRGGLDRY
jgi:hypothetical protein